jgi:hypothetical protein
MSIVRLLPYPQQVKSISGKLLISSRPILVATITDIKEKLAVASIEETLALLPDRHGDKEKIEIRVASASAMTAIGQWLTKREISKLVNVGDQGYLLKVDGRAITLVGKTPIGTLYGAQTLIQLFRHSKGEKSFTVPYLRILDYPSVEKRFLAPSMAWYAGYGRIGFCMQLWGWEQWKWFVDWCLQHKVNGLNLCIYGYYPFRFDPYPETVLKDIEMNTWIKEAGNEVAIRYTHPNITNEFLPDLIKYANERGIEIYCYFGLDTFNGGYAMAHPESRFVSSNPDKFRQFKYNLCPSREDVVVYLERSVRRLLEIGFNGIVFEESEGGVFCECSECKRKYYGADNDARIALHKATYDLLARFDQVMKETKPDAVLGLRMWRQGSEMGTGYLKKEKDQIPSRALIFWSNGIDYDRFVGWVEAFGPERIIGQDAESLGWAATYGRLIYLFPEQYSNYVQFVDPAYKPSFPQNLWNDIRQYKQAAKHHCQGVTGYAFDWNGWEIGPLSLAQYGWNPNIPIKPRDFVQRGFQHLFGVENGSQICESILNLPIVLESRICEDVIKQVPRDDPVKEGLVNIVALSVPTKFREAKGEVKALTADLRKAQKSFQTFRKIRLRFRGDTQYLQSLAVLENAAARTMKICRAAIDYRKALALEKTSRPRPDRIIWYLRSALDNAEGNYRIIRENSFDLTDEFFFRARKAVETIRRRLEKWTTRPLVPSV